MKMMQREPMTTDEMRVLELNAEYLGVKLGMLMQQAGREIARVIVEREDVRSQHVLILAGLGGNGGDGMVAARHLVEAGADVEICMIGDEARISSPDTAENWSILKNLHTIDVTTLNSESDIKSCKSIAKADIIVDAMLGFGLTSAVRQPMLTAVKLVNKSSARKYSIDIPTGINSDTGEVLGDAVKADVTVTMHAPKTGLLNAADYAGEVIPVAIGIPPEAYRICGKGDLWLFAQRRPKHSKKGDFGKILIVGGSDVYSGAPALSGIAALRTGADLVSVIAAEPVVSAVRSYSPNLMVKSMDTQIFMPDSLAVTLQAAKENDVVAVGPGLGRDKSTRDAVRTLLGELSDMGMRMVIDADALKHLAQSKIILDPINTLLTPHWGELQILLNKKLSDSDDIENRIEQALEAAAMYNSTILLKGPTDAIVSPDGSYKVNRTGVPAMTVGGTGDVLTGICATLLSRGRGAFKAAAAAAFVSGRAGELAYADLGDHLMATDCIEAIPDAMVL
ncbi:NAD(P)H-hydrate dehydratase [Candidatus Thorarchaeota archaeon]|nr:MAG: NAD(P)H-hydrate dehydratase [Candidatus Thorarchaeota archaeon]